MLKSGLSAGLLLPDNHLPFSVITLRFLVNMRANEPELALLSQLWSVGPPADGAVTGLTSTLLFHAHKPLPKNHTVAAPLSPRRCLWQRRVSHSCSACHALTASTFCRPGLREVHRHVRPFPAFFLRRAPLKDKGPDIHAG